MMFPHSSPTQSLFFRLFLFKHHLDLDDPSSLIWTCFEVLRRVWASDLSKDFLPSSVPIPIPKKGGPRHSERGTTHSASFGAEICQFVIYLLIFPLWAKWLVTSPMPTEYWNQARNSRAEGRPTVRDRLGTPRPVRFGFWDDRRERRTCGPTKSWLGWEFGLGGWELGSLKSISFFVFFCLALWKRAAGRLAPGMFVGLNTRIAALCRDIFKG